MSRYNIKQGLKLSIDDVTASSPDEAMQSKVGEVYLVRSNNTPERGDHFILISGGLVQKQHGIRPETQEFPAPTQSPLKGMSCKDSPVILKLNDYARQQFYTHYKIPKKYRK